MSQNLLFRNGGVFDGLSYAGVRAVGVRDGRVVAIGDERDVRRVVGRDHAAVDLDGGLLAPSFQDAHMHPVLGGVERLWCEMNQLSTREDYLAAIRDHHDRQPADGWFRAAGWSVDAFGPHGPTAAELDRVVPDRPAFIPSSDHHNAWVNSRALQLAGVTDATPDPPDGWLERDDEGNPTGTLREAAMSLVGDHLTTTRAEYDAGLAEAQRYLFSLGITGWHDALIGGYAGIDDPTPAYLDALGRGRLAARVRASMWWDRHRGLEQVEELVDRREHLAGHGLDAGSVKLMVDGIAETFTASMSEPYQALTGCPCGDRGLSFLPAGELRRVARALDAAGFQLHFHAIGDQAVHDALGAVEHARRGNGMQDLRHQIAHLQLVRPEDRPRFRELGVVANLEGMWADADDPAVQVLAPHLDEERMRWHYPFADIVARGAAVAGGSDWPVNPPEPVTAMHVLVNRAVRTGDGELGEPLLPGQGLSLAQAMAAYTSGSAYVNHSDGVGHLQVGATADLVVLARDPFAGDRKDVGDNEVRATFLAGRPVFGAAG